MLTFKQFTETNDNDSSEKKKAYHQARRDLMKAKTDSEKEFYKRKMNALQTEMAQINKIKKDSSVPEVRTDVKHWPDMYKQGSSHVGHIGDLELHHHEREDGTGTYFTWHPKTRHIHHVISFTRNGGNLEDITGNGRPNSDVKYADVLHHLAQERGENIITKSSSEGAAKSWEALRSRSGVKIQKFTDSKWQDTKSNEPIFDKDHKSKVGKMPIRVTRA